MLAQEVQLRWREVRRKRRCPGVSRSLPASKRVRLLEHAGAGLTARASLRGLKPATLSAAIAMSVFLHTMIFDVSGSDLRKSWNSFTCRRPPIPG